MTTPMTHEARLQTERNIWLATTRPNGKPHLIPIWFVWLNERFYKPTDTKAKPRRA